LNIILQTADDTWSRHRLRDRLIVHM